MVRHSKHRGGFTLLELLVVVAIIGVLAGLLLPAIQKARESGNRTECGNNLRHLVFAVHTYSDMNDCLPPYYGQGVYLGKESAGKTLALEGVFFTHLLYFLDETDVYDAIFNDVIAAGTNTGHGVTLPYVRKYNHKILQCRSDLSRRPQGVDLSNDYTTTSYLPNWHVFSNGLDKVEDPNIDPLWGGYRKIHSFADNTVIIIAEGYANCDGVSRRALSNPEWWSFGIDSYGVANTLKFQVRPMVASGGFNSCDNWRVQSGHPIVNIVLLEGSMRSLTPRISDNLWSSLVNPRLAYLRTQDSAEDW